MKVTVEADWTDRGEKSFDECWYTLDIAGMHASIFLDPTAREKMWVYRVTDLTADEPQEVVVFESVASLERAKKLAEQAISDHLAVSQ